MPENWKLEGDYMEACNCQAACPCIFLSPPTEGECKAVVGWHIDKGNYGKTDVSGLNVALAVHAPGTMHLTKWKAALYVDDRANEDQKNALMTIFSGQAGGHPGRLAAHIGEVLGAASVPIRYEVNSKKRSLKVGQVAEAAIEAMEGGGQEQVTVTNHPLGIAPGYPAVVSKSSTMRYEDHGYQWILSERNGLFSPFTYQSQNGG